MACLLSTQKKEASCFGMPFFESTTGYGAGQVISILHELDDFGSFLPSHINKWKCDFQYNSTINNHRLPKKPVIYSLLARDNLIRRIVQNDLHLSFQNLKSDNVVTQQCF